MEPTPCVPGLRVKQVAAGGMHSCVLTDAGEVKLTPSLDPASLYMRAQQGVLASRKGLRGLQRHVDCETAAWKEGMLYAPSRIWKGIREAGCRYGPGASPGETSP